MLIMTYFKQINALDSNQPPREKEIKKFIVTLISISWAGVRIISTFVTSHNENPSISSGRDSLLFLLFSQADREGR